MECFKCGAKIPSDSTFCEKCGVKLGVPKARVGESSSDLVNKKSLVIIGLAILMGIIIVIVLLVVRQSGTVTSEENSVVSSYCGDGICDRLKEDCGICSPDCGDCAPEGVECDKGNIAVELKDACYDSKSGNYKILVVNDGIYDIVGMDFRLYPAEGSPTRIVSSTDMIPAFGIKNIEIVSIIGTIRMIESFPKIMLNGEKVTCSNVVNWYGNLESNKFLSNCV